MSPTPGDQQPSKATLQALPWAPLIHVIPGAETLSVPQPGRLPQRTVRAAVCPSQAVCIFGTLKN